MKIKLIILWVSFILIHEKVYPIDLDSSKSLLERVIPKRASSFLIEYIPSIEGKDIFEIDSKGDKILLRGNNGVAVASALKYYLNNYCKTNVSWNSFYPELPEQLPKIAEKIRIVTPYEHRYYLNYVTFNYSTVWWDWKRWEQELDWMAMNGINMPLAILGQNKVWQKVYNQLGLNNEDLANFFSGPAYTAFNWMGLLDGWSGPMSQDWIDSQSELQKQILKRARELGMTPVLPAFTGHIPSAFKEKYPDSKIKHIQWTAFPEVDILDPSDPMFLKIGKMFTEELINMYGTDHYYSSDPFIEVMPPSNDSLFLNDMSRTIYRSMADADDQAVWVMQGWMFYFKSDFWGKDQIKSFLKAVPDDRMIVLDLWTDNKPLWHKTEAYYGKKWLWCMLQNFGGYQSMFGKMSVISQNPIKDLRNPASGQMAGLGLTMEGIELNSFIYDMMLSNIWLDKPISVEKWVDNYALTRYNQFNENTRKAWRHLAKTGYDYKGDLNSGGCKSMITSVPGIGSLPERTDVHSYYDPVDFMPAWRLLLEASPQLKDNDNYLYDLTDVTRQALSNYSNELHQQYKKAYDYKDLKSCKKIASRFLSLIDDMDELMATQQSSLLGKWILDARNCGKTLEEKDLYEQNAKNLLTLWHGKEKKNLQDYSARQWSGLLKSFYRIRWEKFFDYAHSHMKKGISTDVQQFTNELRNWEWDWINARDNYPSKPNGNSLTVSKKLYKKYAQDMITAYKSGLVKNNSNEESQIFNWY